MHARASTLQSAANVRDAEFDLCPPACDEANVICKQYRHRPGISNRRKVAGS